MEQRANNRFCYKLGKTKRIRMRCQCRSKGGKPSAENVFMNDLNAFAKGRKRLRMSHDPVPSISRIPEMIDKVRQMLAQNRRLTLRLIAEYFGIRKDTPHTIVSDDLGKWKICSQFVAAQAHRRAESKTDGNFWRLQFHV